MTHQTVSVFNAEQDSRGRDCSFLFDKHPLFLSVGGGNAPKAGLQPRMNKEEEEALTRLR